MKKIVAFIVAVLFVATAAVASAASPQDVKAFQSTLHRNSERLLTHKKTGEGWVVAVYAIKGTRYVVHYLAGGSRIQFDIRPNRSKDSRLLVSSSNGMVTNSLQESVISGMTKGLKISATGRKFTIPPSPTPSSTFSSAGSITSRKQAALYLWIKAVFYFPIKTFIRSVAT